MFVCMQGLRCLLAVGSPPPFDLTATRWCTALAGNLWGQSALYYALSHCLECPFDPFPLGSH